MNEETIPQRVRDMAFADLYLGHKQLGPRFSEVPGATLNPVPADPALSEDLHALFEQCLAFHSKAGSDEMRLTYDGATYRVTVLKAVECPVYVLRKVPRSIRSLQQLGLPSPYVQRLMAPDLTGLVIISGQTSTGKSTTAASIIAQRLTQYGGIAVTAEDPVEMPLEGQHGPGICFQTHAKVSEGGYEAAASKILRSGAKIILLGEILSGQVAIEAIRAGINGHLVLTTVHASDPQTAISRLITLASEYYSPATASSTLADGLAYVLHQRLVGDTRRLEVRGLDVAGSNSAQSIIRTGKLEQLHSEMELQLTRLLRSA